MKKKGNTRVKGKMNAMGRLAQLSMLVAFFGVQACQEKASESSASDQSQNKLSRVSKSYTASNSATPQYRSERLVAIPREKGKTQELLFQGKARIRINDYSVIEKNRGHPSNEVPLQVLPFWSREKVREIRHTRQEIFAESIRLAKTYKNKSAQEKKAWVRDWNEKHREQLADLNFQEKHYIEHVRPPIPAQEQIDSFIEKMAAAEPEFMEADILVIEHLLPPIMEINSNKIAADKELQKLIFVYRELVRHYPQSVKRQELRHIIRNFSI